MISVGVYSDEKVGISVAGCASVKVSTTQIHRIHENAECEKYDGSHIVTPLAHDDQILKTEGKHLKTDIIVQKIPYSEVSNTAGGTTVIIG